MDRVGIPAAYIAAYDPRANRSRRQVREGAAFGRGGGGAVSPGGFGHGSSSAKRSADLLTLSHAAASGRCEMQMKPEGLVQVIANSHDL